MTLFQLSPSLVFNQIKTQSISAVPFASYLDIKAVEVGRGTSVARLDAQPHVYNHVGTVHAGAQFSLAETASGMAMAGALAAVILNVRPVVMDAQIQYSRPGTGALTAHGKVREDIDGLLETLERERKVRLNVDVQIIDESGTVVSEMSVQWHIRGKT